MDALWADLRTGNIPARTRHDTIEKKLEDLFGIHRRCKNLFQVGRRTHPSRLRSFNGLEEDRSHTEDEEVHHLQ